MSMPSHPPGDQDARWRGQEGERCLVVGIGASAGGLEAFERFLRRVPSDGGLAYVLVQHLDPGHESLLADILSRVTHLPVGMAEEGQRIERDHVYAIPPDRGLVIEGAVLHLVPREGRGSGAVINTFLAALADDQRENAVGIVLSGTGSDGALGIAAVKRYGGRTFAQEPGDARYESMPAAAIATGAVDQVLPVEEIPAALVALAAERRRHPPESARGEAEGLARALDVVRGATGHDFSRYKRSTVLRRFHRRMAAIRVASVGEYAAHLESNPDEIGRLAEDLTINVTSFFRDGEPFRALERSVIPDLLERRLSEGIRVWVPGCASGEEAYSIAMLLSERMADLPRPPRVQVFATDIDLSALAEARRGFYASAVEQQVSPERLARFFARRADGYAVVKALRDLCIFTEHDLARDPPFSRMDLVSCRNLLIYLEPVLQRRVVEILHYALRPGGYLLLGRSETIDNRDLELFEVVDKVERLYRRREVRRRLEIPPLGPRALALEQAPRWPRGNLDVRSAAERSRNIVLEEFAPPSVVVSAGGEVKYYWGAHLSAYLPIRAGAPATNLVQLARSELRVEVLAALHNAARLAKTVTYKDLSVEVGGAQRRVDVTVRPLPPVEQDAEPLFLVVFDELRGVPAPTGTPLDPPTSERYVQLQRDLESTQERLQATIDELENANEALHVSNEQLQSLNEELHSSNEELQTSQEELQSVNEELNTLNAELSKKVDELELLYGDLQNLFQSTQIATIFLDRESRIARFTPAATSMFRLEERDAGRPLASFAARFEAGDIHEDVQRVMETLEPSERLVRTADGARSYLVRMNPYRTPSNVIAGVVVSFIDVTELKRTEAALRDAVAERERAEQALRDADRRKDEFLAVLSHELRNPLAPIRSGLHVLERAPAGAPAAERAQQVIGRQVGHLARLVDDLLDVTRITRGKLQVDQRPLQLERLAERTAEDHRELLKARGVSLAVDVPDEPVWVDGDATRLAQAIGNLLQNAAKYSSSGGAVRLSVQQADGAAVVRVRDTGAGIDPKVIPTLFQPFTQADRTLDRRLGGLGLGLALVKGLVEAHGGTVALTSGGPGTGTEVVLRLPPGAPPPAADVARTTPSAPRRVLVVEDNVDAAQSLRDALTLEKHAVEVAYDGPGALERARTFQPEVVFCDVGLPGMDGYAVARALRREPALSGAFLIAFSGYATPEDQRLSAEAGFDIHLAKPGSMEAIRELVGRAPVRNAPQPPARPAAPA